MGFRTVVVLSNDQAGEWEKDPELGKKIAMAMNFAMGTMSAEDKHHANLGYGRVVECAHADQNTLAVIHDRTMTPIGHSGGERFQGDDKATLAMLKDAAAKFGFTLTRKRVPKAKVVGQVLQQLNGK